PSASAPLITLPSTAQISAPSADVEWTLVAGIRLASSNDRGGTSTPRGLPPSTQNASSAEISFVSGREGWLLLGDVPGDACAQQSVTLWHTTDAGATWTKSPLSGIAAAQCKSNVSFVDPQHGFVVGHDPAHASVIYRTADGGSTWQTSAALPPPP